MPKYADVHLDLDEINNSELVALCRWVGIKNASRAWPREVLLDTLRTLRPPDVPQSLSDFRSPLSKWLKRYWKRIQMQAQKKVCPECPLCSEAQVLACYSKNAKHLKGSV